MSRSEYDRAWGTAGWLDDHEFMGSGSTVRCQRGTKPYEIAEKAARGAAVIKAVYRKEFAEGDELCAAFLWRAGGTGGSPLDVLRDLHMVIGEFHARPDVEGAYLTTFLYDVPSGYWRAIVVFRRVKLSRRAK